MLVHAGIPLADARGLTREEAAHIVDGISRAREREARAAAAAIEAGR
jgi:hypothetical protein